MNIKNKEHNQKSYSYVTYLHEFLKIDPQKTKEDPIKPYEIGIGLANKDIKELKDILTTLKKSSH